MEFYATGVQPPLFRNTAPLFDHLSMLWRRQAALKPFRIVQAPLKRAEMLKEPAQLQPNPDANSAALTELAQLSTCLLLRKELTARSSFCSLAKVLTAC